MHECARPGREKMSNVVAMQSFCFKMILRVIVDGSFCYYTTTIERQDTPSDFSMREIRDLFSIKTDADWLTGSTNQSWLEARNELARKVNGLPRTKKVEAVAYFVSVWPRRGEIFTRLL